MTLACQAALFMEFPRQEYWSGLPFPSPGDLPNPGIEPGSPTLEADTLTSEPLKDNKKGGGNLTLKLTVSDSLVMSLLKLHQNKIFHAN